MIVIRENTKLNGYFVSHHNHTHNMLDSVTEWNLAQDCVLIDGAIVDPQFLEKTPVGLFCKSKRMAEFVQELIESKDMK